jgi:hypothetical protein
MTRRKLERAVLIVAVVFITSGIVRIIDRGPDWLGFVLGIAAAVLVVSVLDVYRARGTR